MEVFVTGGTGYIGRAVLGALGRRGHRLRVLRRPGGRPLGAPAVLEIPGDLHDPEALGRGLRGADAVVHLVGIIRERAGSTFQDVHVEGTRRVLEAAVGAHVRRVLHMSALGADARSTLGYLRSKGEAESLVRAAPVDWTIFRPSVVFGPGGPGPTFLSELRTKLLSLPLHPLFGRGDQVLQPVASETVAEAFATALERRETVGKTYPLAGPDVVTVRDILEALARREGRTFRPVSLPVGVMKALVPLLQRLPGFPLTEDQFSMLLQGSVEANWQSVYEELDLPPVPFDVGGDAP